MLSRPSDKLLPGIRSAWSFQKPQADARGIEVNISVLSIPTASRTGDPKIAAVQSYLNQRPCSRELLVFLVL